MSTNQRILTRLGLTRTRQKYISVTVYKDSAVYEVLGKRGNPMFPREWRVSTRGKPWCRITPEKVLDVLSGAERLDCRTYGKADSTSGQ